MKLRVDAETLADSLAWLLPCIPRVPPVPVQAGVLLAAGEDLVIEAAGMDASMKATERAEIADPGSVLVPGRFLHQLVAMLKGPLTLEATDSTLRLSCGRSNYELPLLPINDYIRADYGDVEALGEVDAHAFKRGLQMIAHAIDPRAAVDVHRGVHMVASRDDQRLEIEGTDRYRVARTFMPWIGQSFESTPDAGHLADVVKGLTTRLKLGTTAGRLMVADPSRSAILASYQSKDYPKLDALLRETEPAYEVTFQRADLLAALKRLGQLRDTKMTPVWMDITESSCDIELVNGGDTGRGGIEVVDCVATRPLALSFNPIYLAESVAAHDTDEVVLSAPKLGLRVAPRVSGDKRLASIVMQIRVPGRGDDQ